MYSQITGAVKPLHNLYFKYLHVTTKNSDAVIVNMHILTLFTQYLYVN